MAEDKSFQDRVRRIGELVEEVESIADPVVRDGVLSVTLDDPWAKSRLSLKAKPDR